MADAQQQIATQVPLPPGSWLDWGGQFENLVAVRQRLSLVVPLCFFLIFLLLFSAFNSTKYAVLVFHDQPLTVYGLPPRTPSKAVRVRVTTDEAAYTATYHVVRVGDRWRWVLSDKAARGFARGPCPA